MMDITAIEQQANTTKNIRVTEPEYPSKKEIITKE
jgi:hypothetical protein